MFAPRGWLSRRWKRQVYRALAGSALFSAPYYRAQYLGGFSRLKDPIWHFIDHGWKSGHSPSISFDTAYYLEKNDDVRVAGLNPLFHFLKYGQSERRLCLRSVTEAQHAVAPEASPLRYFITPSLNQNRISILVDSSSGLEVSEKSGDAAVFLAQLAATSSSSLRILYRTGNRPNRFISEIIHELPNDKRLALEVTEIPLTLTYSDVPFYDEEQSIATSWSSALALRFTCSKDRSHLLRLDNGELRLDLNSVDTRRSIFESEQLVPNSWPELSVFELKRSPSPTAADIAAVVDVGRFPRAYLLLNESLLALAIGPRALPSDTRISLVGNPGPRFTVGEDIRVSLRDSRAQGVQQVTTRCVIIISSQEDPAPESLWSQGFDVIHVSPEWETSTQPMVSQEASMWRVPFSSEALSTVLGELLT